MGCHAGNSAMLSARGWSRSSRQRRCPVSEGWDPPAAATRTVEQLRNLDRGAHIHTAKTLGVLMAIAAVIGIAVAVVENLMFDDPSFNTALVSGAIAGIVVVLVLRPVDRHFRRDDR